MPDPVLFAAAPDASFSTIERIEWLTDLKTSANGTEQRVQIRRAPWFTYRWTSTALPGSREAEELAALRIPAPVRVPLWPHAVVAGNPTRGKAPMAPWFGWSLDRQIYAFAAAGVADPRGNSGVFAPAITVANHWLVAPTADGLLQVERSIEHETDRVSAYSVEARLQTHYETGSQPSSSATAAALALPPLSHDWSASIVEDVQSDVNRFDNGRVWLEKVRYTKRAVAIQLAADGAESINSLRTFLFACRGRLNSFTWLAPIDPIPHTWRLAGDVVEIEYVTPLLAYTRLRLIQL